MTAMTMLKESLMLFTPDLAGGDYGECSADSLNF
jgi:hypothetical protein